MSDQTFETPNQDESAEKYTFSLFGRELFRVPEPLRGIYDFLTGREKEETVGEMKEIAGDALKKRRTIAEEAMLGLLDNENEITPKIVEKLPLDNWFFRSPWLRSRVGLGMLRFFPPFAKAYGFFSKEEYPQNREWIATLATSAANGDAEYETRLLDSADDLRLMCEYMEGKEIDWNDVLDKDQAVTPMLPREQTVAEETESA